MSDVDANDWTWRTRFVPRFGNPPIDGYEAWAAFDKDRKTICTETSSSIDTGYEQAVEEAEEDYDPTDWFIPDHFPYTHANIDELGDWPQRCSHTL